MRSDFPMLSKTLSAYQEHGEKRLGIGECKVLHSSRKQLAHSFHFSTKTGINRRRTCRCASLFTSDRLFRNSDSDSEVVVALLCNITRPGQGRLDGENSETIVPLPVMIHQVRYVACEKSDSDVIDIVSERRGECDRRGDTVAHSEGRNARRGRAR
jgi:hypothetical protein